MENKSNTEFTFALPKGNSSIIKVIGVGGGGNNALKYMYEKGIHGVDFIICNTDAQTLDNNPISTKVQLGVSITEGLGAGADPEVGEKAAIESIDEIKAVLGNNTKMVFITAGMGGGTGTGAAPVIAKIAKEMGILTVGIVTVPFSFEGKRRLDQAEIGLEKFRNNVDSLIVINNDKLRQQFGNLGFKSGFSKADEVLTNAAKAMAEVITGHFLINIDFRDAKSVLANSGTALMSTGVASGENKAEEAVKKALDSPLLNDNKITGAKNVLLLIRSGNEEATMDEIGLISDYIQQEAGNTADIIFGVGIDEELGDAVSVLVIATGFSKEHHKHAGPTEKIKIKLGDDSDFPKKKFESPFKSTLKEEEKPIEKDLFHLDDAVESEKIGFKFQDKSETIITETKEVQTEFFVVEDVEPSHNVTYAKNIEYDLFHYEEEIDEEPTSQSFRFEPEEQTTEKEQITTEEVKKTVFSNEKPIEFTFMMNEPAQKEIFSETQEITLDFPEAKKAEETPVEKVIEEKKIFIQDPETEFTFETKTTENLKNKERRDKLKEFNSRYQVTEEMNEFESIPAFRRKNIDIDTQNASEQQISSFLSENNGKMQLRENRFLNKDVD